MKLRPNDLALFFFLGAIVTSVPWSWLLTPPIGLSQQQLSMIGGIWRFVFVGACFVGALGYAAGVALYKSQLQRKLSVVIGAVFGLSVVAGSQLPQFASLDFGPLALAAVVVGLLAGLAVGLRERRANKPTGTSQLIKTKLVRQR
jgi:hypothetical protein